MHVSSYAISGATIFLGAFLLFAIQPIAGKFLLPSFGGSSSVWATSLLFFTTALFVGYLYVYVLAKQKKRVQVTIHSGLVALALIFILGSFVFSDGPTVFTDEAPALGVLLSLALFIGVPYLLLATTGPLVQYWYGTVSGKEPYALYALSNVASLLALLSYPFVIEPFLALGDQLGTWAILFFMYACLYLFMARTYSQSSVEAPTFEQTADTIQTSRIAMRSYIRWTLLASLPAFMLVATTTQITQVIAPVPLLWIAPLLLYLLTFIFAFGGRGQTVFVPLFFLVAAGVAFWFTPASYADLAPQVASYLALLFFCGLACHALLYRTRPNTERLPLFYLLLSLGGALGSLAASVIPPVVFSDYWEFPLGLTISSVIAIWILPEDFFPRILDARRIFITKMFLILFAASFFMRTVLTDDGTPTVETRNFYGNAEVMFEPDITSLMHGTTLHGTQFADPADARLPTTYYSPGSGVGRAILYAQEVRGREAVRVGTLGLGTGSIAAYCRPGDEYVFYEIDARIYTIARSYFSYLNHCEGAEVRIGDGRLLLEREIERNELGMYDVLAIDAFSDDTIPVHLLTREALGAYVAHLRSPQSILAIHISNRYLDLGPVVFRLAAELGLNAMLISDSGDSGAGGTSSSWVVLTQDIDVLYSNEFANTDSYIPEQTEHVWTDDYSSLLPVLDIPTPWN